MWPERYESVSVLPVVVGVNEDDGQAALGKVELGLEDGGQLPPILLLGHSPVQTVLGRGKWNENFPDKQMKQLLFCQL